MSTRGGPGPSSDSEKSKVETIRIELLEPDPKQAPLPSTTPPYSAGVRQATGRWRDGSQTNLLDEQRLLVPNNILPYLVRINRSVNLNDFVQKYSLENSRPLTTAASRLLSLENDGTGSSVLGNLTKRAHVLLDELRLYYSEARVASEEFHFEAYSWVALQSLSLHLEPQEMQWTLGSMHTSGRSEFVYDAMIRHKQSLEELARAKCQELVDAGNNATVSFLIDETVAPKLMILLRSCFYLKSYAVG